VSLVSLRRVKKKWDDSEVTVGVAKTKAPSIKAMPAARVLAKQMNVDLSLVTASGPQGLITAEDVKHFMAGADADNKTHSTQLLGQTEALHGVRRVMAQIMAQSHREVVPVTIIEECDLTDLPPKTDITVQLLQAMVAAAKAEPSLNAWFDAKTMERKLFDEVNIGLAVDTPEGLFVPVIKNAETLSPSALRQAIDNYKKTVRDRSIAPSDMQGATITLSNFGMIAGRYATPIIIPPAVAILGCGRTRDVVMPRNGQIVIGRSMPLSLTFDHRTVTGGEATRFLAAVIAHLEGKKISKN
jgi:2-oxoisovalerate dehydrogenase E2 component (dihydrolipoyl transacylase)